MLDVILGILIVYGLVRGMWNGFFSEIASLVSLLVGIWAAIRLSSFARDFLANHVSWNPQHIRIAAFVVTFVAVIVGITLLAKALTTAANFAGFGLINKLLGGLTGAVKMMLIVSVVLNLFAKLNSGQALADKETVEKSILYGPILKMSAFIYPSLKSWFDPVTISVP